MSALATQAQPEPFSTLRTRVEDWIFTTDPKQRIRISRSLMSALVFLISLGLIVYGAFIGLLERREGAVLAGVIAVSCTGFYLALRTGWSLRFSDPSLTLPQMIAALTWCCGAYGITHQGHGGILMLFALVLVFGLFNMNARRVRLSALYGVVAMGLTMAYKCVTDPQHYPFKIELMYFVFVITVMPMISQLAAELHAMRSRLKAQKADLEAAVVRIQELATRDELTGLYNRRQITQVLSEHASRSNRAVVKFWVAVLDLDHFKHINDTWGHSVGDEVLRNFARLAEGVLRDIDLIGRWGGEEFLAVMLAVPPLDPHAGLERLRGKLQNAQVSESVPDLRITFSAGLAAYGNSGAVHQAIERADKALYLAKALGRNQTVMAPEEA